ncbi:MAG TPA: hypothetical protein PKW75_10140 [candidate division Zixibacteria bacterium]|nr:hypothetical protein [candidate division Zixibacteria bacterium]MDD4918639.1 hypothetical protein [candidate division Zixibacteria bacterium]MDM7971747.1 hypothetical protein [candidate division Zixibacteria bacterium]HOD67259.1 hypothetical protein [candidate division Zixibacteria bacterium]HOZ08633.1 hypothetical protein [candidate division Zixibacteria bacterium]
MKPACLGPAVLLAALVLYPPSSRADAEIEFGLNNGYTNNLLSEASAQDDAYSTARLTARWYPLPQLQLSLGTDYTYYNNVIGLGNNTPRAGLIWVPTDPAGRLTFYLEGNTSARRYRAAYSSYSTNEGYLKGSVGFRLNPRFLLRSGIKFNGTNYITPDSTTDADYEQYELFAGVNIALPWSNSFDLEAGLGQTNFALIDAAKNPDFQNPYAAPGVQWPATKFLEDGDFRALYVSPRVSRPLGDKTGISLTYVYRQFLDVDEAVVLGITTDFLSPWTSFFDGSSLQLRIKSYVISDFILTGGLGYWDKTFLRSTEVVVDTIPTPRPDDPDRVRIETRWVDPKDATAREDDMTRLYFGLQRPFTFRGGLYLEPSLGLEYIDNRSTRDNFDYSTTAVTFNILVRP